MPPRRGAVTALTLKGEGTGPASSAPAAGDPPSPGLGTKASGPASGPGACVVAGGVRAFIRLRPVDDEDGIAMFEISPARPQVITIKDPLSLGRREHSFEFSTVFNMETTQDKIFMPVGGPIVDGALLGRSGCVMAYGQTGSGKTYSIFGEGPEDDRGILPRAMERLFKGVEDKERLLGTGGGRLSVSFLEVYMDQVFDLGYSGPDGDAFEYEEEEAVEDETAKQEAKEGGVQAGEEAVDAQKRRARNMSSVSGTDQEQFAALKRSNSAPSTRPISAGSLRPQRGLEVRETPDGTVHVQGLHRMHARSVEEVQHIIDRGLARRATAMTAVNVCSSRSHTVLSVHLPSLGEGPGVHLSFVDLAGSERLAKSKAEGARFQEAMAINSSLTALGKVVLALASDSRTVKHVPYRDSKLTRILSPSLGGGTQVSLLATIHPRVEDYEESLNTLSFADRCKNVARQPQVSYICAKSNQKQKISELRAQVQELKDMIARMAQKGAEGGGGVSRPLDQVDVAIAEALAANAGAAAGVDGKSKRAAGTAIAGSVANAGAGAPAKSSVTVLTGDGQPAIAPDGSAADEVNPQLVALMTVQEDRNRQARNKERAEKKVQELEREKASFDAMADVRQAEVSSLEKRKSVLESELSKLQTQIREKLQARAQSHGSDMTALKETTLTADPESLAKIQQTLMKGRNFAMRQDLVYQERLEEIEQRIDTEMRGLKEQYNKQLTDLQDQLTADLVARHERNLKLEQELVQCREQEQESARKLEAELEDLYDTIFKLVRIIKTAEDGVYPVVRHGDGLKQTVLPEGLRPSDPNIESHPMLFSALEKAEQRVAALEQHVQRPFPAAGRLRRLVAAASGLFDGLDLPIPDEGRSASSSSSASGRDPPGLGLSTVENAFGATWSARHVVQGLLQGEPQTERQLHYLEPERLKELCLLLREEALETFSVRDERLSLKREAEEGLSGEATLAYLKDLEVRRDSIRGAYLDAVERMRRLKIDLEFRRSNLLFSRSTTPGNSRPSTASRSHAYSRPRTPSLAGSRATSRPATATRSRPPTAGSLRGNLR